MYQPSPTTFTCRKLLVQEVSDVVFAPYRERSPRLGSGDQQPDYEAALRYALDRLERELSPNLFYHSLQHTRDDVFPERSGWRRWKASPARSCSCCARPRSSMTSASSSSTPTTRLPASGSLPRRC